MRRDLPPISYMLKFPNTMCGTQPGKCLVEGIPVNMLSEGFTQSIPNRRECYYLRLLLHHIRGPRSFDELNTVNGEVCQTYQEACIKLGLLQDDNHWHHTLEEAALQMSPKRIRNLYAVILTANESSNPLGLWEAFKEYMAEDLLHRARLRKSH